MVKNDRLTEEIVEYEWSHFTKSHVSIIPNRIKSKYFSIQGQKSFQRIKIRFGLGSTVWWTSWFGVGVMWSLFRVIQFDPIWLEEFFCIFITAGKTVHSTIDEHIDTTIQICPMVTVSKIVFRKTLTLEKFTLRSSRIFNDGFNERYRIVLKIVISKEIVWS